MQACLSRPFARAPMSFTCCLLSLGLSLVTHCSKFSSAARGYRLWRLLAQVFFSTRGCAAKGSQFVQKVRLTALSLQCTSALPSVRAGRSCACFLCPEGPPLSSFAFAGLVLPHQCARCPSLRLRRHSPSPAASPRRRSTPATPRRRGPTEGFLARCRRQFTAGFSMENACCSVQSVKFLKARA